MILAALTLLLSLPPAFADDEDEIYGSARVERALRVAWSGGSGGIDAGRYAFRLHERLGTGGAPALTETQATYAWMVNGPWMIASRDRQFQTTVAVFEHDVLTCDERTLVTLLRSADEIAVFDDPAPVWTAFWPAERSTAARWRCTAGDVQADVIGPPEGEPAQLDLTLDRWETRLSLTWKLARSADSSANADDPHTVSVIGRPHDDGPRFARQLVDLVQDGVLYLDAGRFVSGISVVRDDQLSALRPAAFALLRRIGPTALAPGAEELAGGIKSLLREGEGLPWVATNWQTRDPALALPHAVETRIDTPGGAIRLAIVAALDPALHNQIPVLTAEGITISDPVTSVQEQVDRLRNQTVAPDLVILLTNAEPATNARLRTEVRGIDLIVGDATASFERLDALEVRFDPTRRNAAPIALPGHPTLLAEVVLDPGGGIAAIYVQPQPVDLTEPPEEAVLAAVTRVRTEMFRAFDRPLLPAPAGPPGSAISDIAFTRVICEGLLERTGADIVFLPDLPPATKIPGGLSTLLTMRRLRVPDHLERHYVPGDRLTRLLDQLYGSNVPHCGTTLGVRTPTVGGRAIEPDQMYRIITTDRKRQTSTLGQFLDAARAPAALGGKGFEPITDDLGRPRTLRTTAIESLQDLRERYEDDLLTELLSRRTAPPPPRWIFRLRTLSMRVEGFRGAGDLAYANVPETLATAPSSFTIGTAADLSVQYDEERVSWDARLRHAYTSLRTWDRARDLRNMQETADDLQLSTSVTLPGLTTPSILGFAGRPFGESLLDTEWTPIVNANGETLARQLDLSFTLGLAVQPKGILRTLRIGYTGMQDMSRINKQFNLGPRVEAETVVPFGSGLRWATQLNAVLYRNTRDQDERDLRFRSLLDTRLALPMLRGFDVSIYSNLFMFQGRAPETSAFRASFRLGVSLDARGVFVLNR